MAKTLLQIVQEVSGRLAQPVPTYVAGNPDAGVLQMKGLLNRFCEDLITRKFFQQNIREATLTIAAATESQGMIDALCPYGYEGIVLNSFFNRTQLLPVEGGLSPEEWQVRKTLRLTGPYPAFRLRGNELLFVPVPTVGHVYAWEYYSSYFIYNAAEPVDKYRQYWEKDTDTCTVGDALPIAYLTWAWKSAKGLDYTEEFNAYEALLGVKLNRDNRPGVLNMGCVNSEPRPGIVIAPGSWPL